MITIVLGGYGNFGARICRALANSPGVELLIAGRNLAKAEKLAKELGARAIRVDAADPNLARVLRDLQVGLVIHTAGPFQEQGYAVPQAAAEAGAHYIDLADGRRFVCDFPTALDSAFRTRGLIGISGASTVPALSSAVINHLTRDWRSIGSIDVCIAPAQTAPRGIATMQAVLNYCGAPIQVWQDSRWISMLGWAGPSRVEFARLRPRIAALCDIPDLELFPALYPGVKSVMFRAALELGISQRGLAFIGALRRFGIIRQPERLAGLLNRSADLLDVFGSALGGMVVRVKGVDAAGIPSARAWHIAADDDHGPEIPCMAAVLLARKIAAGALSDSGAATSTGLLELADFEPEFGKWNMLTDVCVDQL